MQRTNPTDLIKQQIRLIYKRILHIDRFLLLINEYFITMLSIIVILAFYPFDSVYSRDVSQIGPTAYLGCYKGADDPRVVSYVAYMYRDHSVRYGVTQDWCREFCFTRSDATYFGIQRDYNCLCGDDYDRYGSLSESECNGYCYYSYDGRDRCKNIPSRFYTVCPVGLYGRYCTDVCGNCKNTTRACRRLDGTCSKGDCKGGWTGGKCITDIDECNKTNPCSSRIAQSECINTVGSYNCRCGTGLVLSADRRKCEDINECLGDHRCETDSSKGGCNNTFRSYNCKCEKGYDLIKKEENYRCVDTDECSLNNGSCAQLCHNTEGSFSCSCLDGYQLSNDSKTCIDTDECADEVQVEYCGKSTKNCTNHPGSYVCECQEGAYLKEDGKYCIDKFPEWAMILLTTLLSICLLAVIVIVIICLRKKRRSLANVSEDQSIYQNHSTVAEMNIYLESLNSKPTRGNSKGLKNDYKNQPEIPSIEVKGAAQNIDEEEIYADIYPN